MIFYWIVLDLHTHDLHKNAKKPRVISFLSQILCQTAVRGRQLNKSPTDQSTHKVRIGAINDKQVTRGYNIIADRRGRRGSPRFHGWTDKASFRVTSPRLKNTRLAETKERTRDKSPN